MPVNVRRFSTTVLLILIALTALTNAQNLPQAPPATPQDTPPITTPKPPTAAEIMRERISKAKAFIAVRNYNAAIYELENIRRETSDASVQAVTTVLLMNSYLEQGNYKRAQDFLLEAFNAQKSGKPGALEIYNVVAGQVVKSTRAKVERYRSLGLMVADRNLPLEAVNDVELMRETLELVISQTREIGKDKTKADSAMALLEEGTTARSILARDDYDARRWADEVADSREQLAVSRSVVTNAVDGTTSPIPGTPQVVAVNNPAPQRSVDVLPPAKTTESLPATNPAAANAVEPKPIVVQNPARSTSEPIRQTPPAEIVEPAKEAGPLHVGSLIAYATRQATPLYPAAARTTRTTGIVKVEVTVDESGQVAEVQRASGPSLLQTAAKDAVLKWRFKPFKRDGQPVRATGFVNFNFSL